MPASEMNRHVIRRRLRYALPALFIAGCIGVIVTLSWSLLPGQQDGVRNAPGSSASAPHVAAHWQTSGHDSSFSTGLENLPTSLAGTEVPDGLQVDAQGNLIVSMQLRDVFEYFLSTIGEESLDTIVARLRAYMASRLPASALAEANRILDGYLAWRDNLSTIQQAGGVSASALDLAAVRAQQAQVQASCGQFLDGETCDAFFAEDNLRDNYEVDRLAVLRDDSLSATEKADRLAALTASLPAPMQEQISAVTRYQALQSLTTSLQQEGGSAAELRRIREQVVGAEAADRLETLDLQRAQFRQRVDDWLQERAQLQANAGLSAADRQAQIEHLRSQRFSDTEVIRVQGYERMADRGVAIP